MRNRRVSSGDATSPISASARIRPPGKSTLSFLECTFARMPDVAAPQTRFSFGAESSAAGPDE